MNVQAYLAFNGNCQEALNFYSEIFNAEIKNKQTYEDREIDIPSSYRKKLQHAELKGKGIHIMAYDAAPDTPLNHGNKIHMSVDLKSPEEAEQLFKTLSDSGQVHHNFGEREWGHFGRCTDKYGINWMVNCNR
ncbi:PhnB protein / DNA binding 3-demethylubiquinone-9 3-methyltransferase domain protein [Formosa agariphila KMM 3901]|uniref:PhnB protein / DNA binding 3-demethylubiquinone-9 3-methyltransferase domain protein n=1 Tax=Formosa agariphila (strain DSM 15362 / KCTC 12365 / LMG 23005 / KMM 3901 / M-2Alg 35-1) TaxID=1347342 RepID=T2KM79_FORAG|nr:VOC family protein [Formosa agariphila]CDF79546.1 PhnB protein / DNA binding 3-demethylubiquinone-9 3-methyltransferase domain protein [Formosa agariphila KMM 3901]